jgi:hypothetical protein
MIAFLGIAALGACNGDGEAGAKALDDCSIVGQIDSARADSPPFSSLRGDAVMLGDNPMTDKFAVANAPFNGQCEIGVITNMFGSGSDLHLYNCNLYERLGSLEKERRETEARAAFVEAKTTLTQCLGDGWTTEETTENSQFEIYHKVKFVPETPAPKMGQFTADTLYLTMAYSPFMNHPGRRSGWNVHFQFQEPFKPE